MEYREEVMMTPVERRPMQWGALMAGLVTLTAAGWLLMLFGSAIGMSVADATDLDAMGDGLGTGVILWTVVSWLVAYFLGALVAARLTGSPDQTVGMLHGVVLWGLGSTVTLILAALGLAGLLQTGQTVVTSTLSGSGQLAAWIGENADGELAQSLRDAKSTLSRQTEAQIKQQASELAADVAAPRGEASAEELRSAAEQLDLETMQAVASDLIAGRTESAKSVLARDTSLDDEQIDALVANVSEKIDEQVAEFKAEMQAAVETASDYAQGLLWIAFVAGAIALAGSMGGGVLGASAVDRLVRVRVRATTAAAA